MNHCTLIALIFCITICHSVASTDHGPLCPGLVRTIRTTVRHGYDQEPKNWELFTFRGEVGQKISIAVRRTRPAMDPFLALFSPTGALLASNDDAVCLVHYRYFLLLLLFPFPFSCLLLMSFSSSISYLTCLRLKIAVMVLMAILKLTTLFLTPMESSLLALLIGTVVITEF